MTKMVEYLNPKACTIQLSSPSKTIIKIPGKARVILSDWYMNYCPKYLRVVRIINEDVPLVPKHVPKNMSKYSLNSPKPGQKKILRMTKTSEARKVKSQQPVVAKLRKQSGSIVGRKHKENSKKLFNQACQQNEWSISNNVGIGILSFNRLDSLKRIIGSIRKYTNLSRTTVFVSDESTNDNVKKWLKKQKDIVVLTNQKRLGIAGNTNRLLRCLSRFKYGILLNDDVEVLQRGWDTFYRDAAISTNYHHFCYQQIGVYGAKKNGKIRGSSTYKVSTIADKPHGAVMFFTNKAFKKVGFFDEKFGMYGLEHVDWSTRISHSRIQPKGFHDIVEADKYFKIHQEKSVVPNRVAELQKARTIWRKNNSASRVYVKATLASIVPSISVIIPIRDIGRTHAANVVVNSIRSQLFPNIEIVLVEQDAKQKIDVDSLSPNCYFFANNKYKNQPFTKAMAFNLGVANASHQRILLQDADIICPADYAKKIHNLLSSYEGIHIGSKVLYMTEQATQSIIQTKIIDRQRECGRAVGYFEGGSLACTKSAYFRSGGFNEIFEGYGIEDCDFFERLKHHVKFYNERSIAFIHMNHGRTSGWQQYHRKNKRIFSQIKKQYDLNSYIISLVKKIKTIYPEIAKELKI